jgi:hypothetical protein
VVSHLALIAVLSLMRRKNTALPMLTGRTAGSGPDVVKANRGWLALLLIAAFVGFVAWQASQDLGQDLGQDPGQISGMAAGLHTASGDGDGDGDDSEGDDD